MLPDNRHLQTTINNFMLPDNRHTTIDNCMLPDNRHQRYTEITYNTLPLRKEHFDCPQRDSHALHLKEGGEGSLYSCILQSCNFDVLHRRLGADSDKIPEHKIIKGKNGK
jgi:hypothetical protein